MVTNTLADLESIVSAGRPLTRAEAERVAQCADLVSVGLLGEGVRKAIRGDRVTFGRVCEVPGDALPASRGAAQEVRLTGAPASIDAARARVRGARAFAGGVPLTAFSLADLVALTGHDDIALADLARALATDGLTAVAEIPVDRLGDVERASEAVRAVRHGGLQAWRATVDLADYAARLDIIELAAAIQQATGAFKAFAPLPRTDPRTMPSTGYDDVRTVAVARLVCRDIPSIQVDWPLYGPKLAQVAITYGADDIDGVSPVDDPAAGPRRAPREDIERQIRAAFAQPAERNGRYELLP
jgi:aminodeoxyfutalosine synthase